VEQYESFTYISKAQQSATATHILDTYLSRNSHLEVNVEDKVIRSVTTAIEEGELSNCFQTAKRSVFTLLDGSFHRFKDGPIWDTMVATCGKSISKISICLYAVC
jgi:hypothetical protein